MINIRKNFSRGILFCLFTWMIGPIFVISAQNNFLLYLDAAQFQDTSGNTYMEIYYAIPERSITYVQQENGFTCEILANLTIYYQDSTWMNKLWKIQRVVPDTSQLKSRQLVDLLRYRIDQAGSYRMILRARDLHAPAHSDSVTFSLNARILSRQALEISDLEIASTIQKADPNASEIFNKYTYDVIPNPGAIFGILAPELFYYFESYNLLENISGKKYKVFIQAKSYNGSMIGTLLPVYRSRMKNQNHDVEFGKIDVSSLATGKYLLCYGVCDSATQLLVNNQKEFYIYHPGIESPDTARGEPLLTKEASLNFLMGLSEPELDQEFDKMCYLIGKNQKNLYKSLTDLDARRKIVYSIWQAAASSADPPAQFRQKYLERVQQAQRFSNLFKDGWKTDQGRVYILYGPPSNVKRHPSTTAARPYEIWEYENLQNGVYFVFIDRMGLNHYELFHSTLEGELQNPNWQRFISTSVQLY